MDKREKVIKGLECCLKMDGTVCRTCPYAKECEEGDGLLVGAIHLAADALELLKAQELPDVKPEKLEERTTKWLDQMTAEERLEEIAAILDDWDGYRTAKGLGGLINEVWAYALYPVKAQEPKSVKDTLVVGSHLMGKCPKCYKVLAAQEYPVACGFCGQAVKWDEQRNSLV